MEQPELRQRVGAILAAEESANSIERWAEVERLTDELQAELQATPGTQCPDIVNHYLDDPEIRARDERYAAQQRERVRRFVQTGQYSDGASVSLWTVAGAVIVVVGLVVWLAL